MDALSLNRPGDIPATGVGADERVSGPDLAELHWESARAPMNITAILRTQQEIDPDRLRRALVQRVGAVPRLEQRIQRRRHRRGPPVWTRDPDFTIERHLSHVTCPPPGDEDALLALAAREAGSLLPRDRPLWRAVQVCGLRSGGSAVVLVLHHAVADGVGSLHVLARLADAPPDPAVPELPHVDAPQAPAEEPERPGRVPRSVSGRGDRRRAGRALNQPVGARRRLAVTTTALAPLVAAAHELSATVNDLLLVAAADALAAMLGGEGQDLSSLVVSVPVALRSASSAGELGNRVGVMPVRVSCHGSLSGRVAEVAATTRRRRRAARRNDRFGPSRLLTGPAFGLLTRLGLFQWFIGHQRLVNTFVTNLHGPQEPLTLLGSPVVAVTPFSPIAGNVTVAFTAFSYAGTLSVAVVADAGRWPDATPIAVAVGRALDALAHPTNQVA